MRSVVKQVILALTSVLAAAVLVCSRRSAAAWAYGFADVGAGHSSRGRTRRRTGWRAPVAVPAGQLLARPRRLRPTPRSSRFRAAPRRSRWRRFATASVRRTGFPATIPTMPEIVAHGKRPDVRACSLCHYPNGKGRPGKRRRRGAAGQLFHPDDERLQERRCGRARMPGRPTRTR